MKTIIRIEHPRDGWGIWCSKDENEDNYIGRLIVAGEYSGVLTSNHNQKVLVVLFP